jgi:hypothetical protein
MIDTDERGDVMARDWEQQLKDTFQPHVGEPIEAVGLLQPAGTMGSFGLGRISPLAAMFKNKGVNERAGGLAQAGVFTSTKLAAIVITANKVHAFRTKQKGYGWKVQDELATWDRKDVKFSTEQKKITIKIDLDVLSTGDHYELEAVTAGTKGFHDPFLAAIKG